MRKPAQRGWETGARLHSSEVATSFLRKQEQLDLVLPRHPGPSGRWLKNGAWLSLQWFEACGSILPGSPGPTGSMIRGKQTSLISQIQGGTVTMAASLVQTRWFLLPNLENFTVAPTMNLYSAVNSVSLISMHLSPFLITFCISKLHL